MRERQTLKTLDVGRTVESGTEPTRVPKQEVDLDSTLDSVMHDLKERPTIRHRGRDVEKRHNLWS